MSEKSNIFCSVCWKHFKTDVSTEVTQCGHIFHKDCIREWIIRSKTCPHCRAAVCTPQLRKIFLNCSLSDGESCNVNSKPSMEKQLTEKLKEATDKLSKQTKEFAAIEKKCSMLRNQNGLLKMQIDRMTTENAQSKRVSKMKSHQPVAVSESLQQRRQQPARKCNGRQAQSFKRFCLLY